MSVKRWLAVFVKAALIALAALYLAEYLDLPFVREAGGNVAQLAS